jgi:hypothetical protein
MLLYAFRNDSAAEILNQPQHGLDRLDLASVALASCARGQAGRTM